jgi:hypothetical protein
MADIIKESKAVVDKNLYPIEDLIGCSYALTGYKKEVACGALFGCSKKEMAKEEFKTLVNEFLGRKVK